MILNQPSITEIGFSFLCVGINDEAIPNLGIKYSIITRDSVISIDSTITNNNGIMNANVVLKIGCDEIGKPFNLKIKAESEGYYIAEEIMRETAFIKG